MSWNSITFKIDPLVIISDFSVFWGTIINPCAFEHELIFAEHWDPVDIATGTESLFEKSFVLDFKTIRLKRFDKPARMIEDGICPRVHRWYSGRASRWISESSRAWIIVLLGFCPDNIFNAGLTNKLNVTQELVGLPFESFKSQNRLWK